MMSASGGMIMRVQAPLDSCKFVITGRFEEPEFRRSVRALWMNWTARKGGRRYLKMAMLQAG